MKVGPYHLIMLISNLLASKLGEPLFLRIAWVGIIAHQAWNNERHFVYVGKSFDVMLLWISL